MAPLVWPDDIRIPQSNPTDPIRGALWIGSYSVRESLEIPLWMLEAASCSALRLAEHPGVDCAALQRLKALLFGGVLEDRQSSLGGADADPQDSGTPVWRQQASKATRRRARDGRRTA